MFDYFSVIVFLLFTSETTVVRHFQKGAWRQKRAGKWTSWSPDGRTRTRILQSKMPHCWPSDQCLHPEPTYHRVQVLRFYNYAMFSVLFKFDLSNTQEIRCIFVCCWSTRDMHSAKWVTKGLGKKIFQVFSVVFCCWTTASESTVLWRIEYSSSVNRNSRLFIQFLTFN